MEIMHVKQDARDNSPMWLVQTANSRGALVEWSDTFCWIDEVERGRERKADLSEAESQERLDTGVESRVLSVIDDSATWVQLLHMHCTRHKSDCEGREEIFCPDPANMAIGTPGQLSVNAPCGGEVGQWKKTLRNNLKTATNNRTL